MGRTSKFTFPVPGRRQKPAPPPPPPPGSLSKAQKILGASEINTGSPSAKQWDTASMSGISVCVSETTCSYSDATLGLLDNSEDEEADQVPELRPTQSDGRREWEQESDIIPPMIRRPSGDSLAKEVGSISDASSMRRKRMSSASILSYYDKSKMPLSISQQTSSSAMAKGLPSKANALLDMNNASLSPKKKKKPARLDISHLFPSRSKTSGAPSARGMVLGPDLMVKSPSIMSMNSEAGLPPIWQRLDRKLQKKASVECNPSRVSRTRGTNDITGLHSLYSHYEQMTFRDVLGEDTEGVECEWPVSDAPLTGDHDRGGITPTIYEPRDEALLTPTQDLAIRSMLPPKATILLPSPTTADCSASISSRHTRTSKASKRTTHSLQDSDLQEKSVLSLSDDSEDDAPAIEPTSISTTLSVPNERSDTRHPLTSGTTAGTPSRTAVEHRSRRQSSGQAPIPSFRPTSHHFLTPPPTTPPTASLPEPPKNRRTSIMSQVPSRTDSVRSHSQASTATTSSRGSRSRGNGLCRSNTTMHKPSSPMSGTQRCSRSPTQPPHAKPAPGNATHNRKSVALPLTNSRSSILPHHLPHLAGSSNPPQRNTSDQPTPPLSPASVDFSIRLEGINYDGNSRYMVVTKQEERLLAALRSKRKHMRETLLAEFEDTSSNGSQRHARSQSNSSSIASLDAPGSPASCRRNHRVSIGTVSSGSSATTMEPPASLHKRRRSSLCGPPSHITIAPSTSHSDPTPTRPAIPGDNSIYKPEYYFPTSSPSTHLKPIITSDANLSPCTPYKGYKIPAPQHLSFISSHQGSPSAERHERVLLYLDRPVKECDPEEQFDEEPSPDLSDLVKYEDLSPVTPVAAKRISQCSSELSPKAIRERHDTDFAVEESSSKENSDEGEEEVPRPDSPISPIGSGSLAPPPVHHQGRAGLRISAVGPSRSSWWGEGKDTYLQAN